MGSSARSAGTGFPTLFIEHGEGSRIYDIDGNEYIDYWLAAGPLLLGHRPKKVIDAVKNALDTRGSAFGASNQLEYEVAEMLIQAVPCFERVAFLSSGAEVVMFALRLARA